MTELEMMKGRTMLPQGQSNSDLVERVGFARWQHTGFMLPNLLAMSATKSVCPLGQTPFRHREDTNTLRAHESRLWNLAAASGLEV